MLFTAVIAEDVWEDVRFTAAIAEDVVFIKKLKYILVFLMKTTSSAITAVKRTSS